MERDGRQRDAVVKLVLDYLGERMRPGVKARDLLSKDEITELAARVCDGILKGSIPAGEKIQAGLLNTKSGSLRDEHYPLHSYARNILYCWLRRDRRLNGNTRYRPHSDLDKIVAKDPVVLILKECIRNLSYESKQVRAGYNQVIRSFERTLSEEERALLGQYESALASRIRSLKSNGKVSAVSQHCMRDYELLKSFGEYSKLTQEKEDNTAKIKRQLVLETIVRTILNHARKVS